MSSESKVQVYQRIKDIETHTDCWHPGTPHVVGVSLQVHFVHSVNTVEQTFACGFYVSYEWQPSKEDIEQFKMLKAEGTPEEFAPDFVPQLRFPNCLSFEQRTYKTYLDGSTYTFLTNGKPDTRGAVVNMEQDYMIAARLAIRGTFGEPFELEQFPYDVQDMKIMIGSSAIASTQILVPHFRRNEFVKIQMNVSSLPEWNFDRCLAEFSLSDPSLSARGYQFSNCTLNFKLVRKYKAYILRVMSMMAVISLTQFTVFSLDPVEDAADRIANSFALVLTALVFMFVVASSLPNVPYLTQLDKYIYAVFFLMLLMSIECAIVKHMDNADDCDRGFLIGFALAWVMTHVATGISGYRSVKQESVKIGWTSDDYRDHGLEEIPAMGVKSNKVREPHYDYWSTGEGAEKHVLSKSDDSQQLSITRLDRGNKHNL